MRAKSRFPEVRARAGALVIAAAAAAVAITGGAASAARAAVPVTLNIDTLFYCDNTEFFNDFRSGETIFGVNGRVFLNARLGGQVSLRGGVFANQRFGSEEAFDQVRPLIALHLAEGSHRFVFGTLETARRDEGPGPDRTTLHGLLPPLQREDLIFTRPLESGVQWLVGGGRVRSDLWLNWQRLNTPEHRELLDAGLAGEVRIAGPFGLGWQSHVVHHGGQLYHEGTVADSVAYGLGLIARGRPGRFLDQASLELYGLLASDVPDREVSSATTSGSGVFLRLAAEHAAWRSHLIAWSGNDFVKAEGDPNYLSLSEDGEVRKTSRSYGEFGLARVFRPVPGVELEASARLHRVDDQTEYSYRVIAVVRIDTAAAN